ncbi:hypothetical protein [Aureibacter tunicatorum]|uniref:Uncharacterized protein n=1 Tax=Aureibacter tunicatorum TaxID=866807 RepID=A0AAE3XKR2_9BACT|nr:hypothetical protein [Aureibacter tunicatorum]MDR6238222.1 hypothetical protein [Aureibacter tunicatorum]BDD03255.1 hypothetical protein AUTU_07380 [Aureibacter tunicatorum]
MIDYIIHEKAQGNTFQELNFTMKLMLKGIPVKHITDESVYDPSIVTLIRQAADEFEVNLPEEFFKLNNN